MSCSIRHMNTKYTKGPSINVNMFLSVQTIHFLRPPPPPKKKSTHQHFLSAKSPLENNKNQAKKLKMYRKKCLIFKEPPSPCWHLWTALSEFACIIFYREPPWLYKSYCPSDMQIWYHPGKMELSFYQPASIWITICQLGYPLSTQICTSGKFQTTNNNLDFF